MNWINVAIDSRNGVGLCMFATLFQYKVLEINITIEINKIIDYVLIYACFVQSVDGDDSNYIAEWSGGAVPSVLNAIMGSQSWSTCPPWIYLNIYWH